MRTRPLPEPSIYAFRLRPRTRDLQNHQIQTGSPTENSPENLRQVERAVQNQERRLFRRRRSRLSFLATPPTTTLRTLRKAHAHRSHARRSSPPNTHKPGLDRQDVWQGRKKNQRTQRCIQFARRQAHQPPSGIVPTPICSHEAPKINDTLWYGSSKPERAVFFTPGD